MGASGSGKSTLLRCVDLLEEIDDGDVFLDGEVITDPSVDPTAVRRRLGMVFQTQPLPAHAGPRERGARARPRPGHPDRLSGAQQLRVAIVRALATDPRALLLGEVCFLHEGRVLVRGPAEQVLSAPERPETRRFLRRLLEAR